MIINQRKFTIAAVLLALIPLSLQAKTPEKTVRFVLLPIEQSDIPAASRLSDNLLHDAVLEQITRLSGFELADYDNITEQMENDLIDQVVFELLITDDVTESLQNMADNETPKGRLQTLCLTAQQLQIDTLVQINVTPHQYGGRITIKIIDTKSAQCTNIRSICDSLRYTKNMPRILSQGITRSLWQKEN